MNLAVGIPIISIGILEFRDFNYDGVVDGSDYTLLDNAFNTQGATLNSAIAAPTAEVNGSVSTTAVPEPATTGLLGAAAVIGLLGRRRDRLVGDRQHQPLPDH